MAYPHTLENFKKLTCDLLFNPLNYEAWFSLSKNLPFRTVVLPGVRLNPTPMAPLGLEGRSQTRT